MGKKSERSRKRAAKTDALSTYYRGQLAGQYDCVDRIVLNAYFSVGQTGGGFRTWWRRLTGADATLDQEHLQRLAGAFSRRVRAYAREHAIALKDCASGERKQLIAEQHLPTAPAFHGVFLILVAKAPAPVWEVRTGKKGSPHLERKHPWPYVNHYHFHIIDPDWGHITIKMSGHPPFGAQIMLNGHEWVERQARKRAPSTAIEKEGNCFVGGSLRTVGQLADILCTPRVTGQLAAVCERWVYSSCLCFGLDLDEQRRSGFRYQYSCLQLEYSRNLLFRRGVTLDAVYQGVIERSRTLLGVEQLKTILGWKHRPHHNARYAPRLERIVNTSDYDLTVFKVHFGKLTLKMYDKGARVLRIEAIAHDAKGLRRGNSLPRFPLLAVELQRMVLGFLDAMQAAHVSFLDAAQLLDQLPQPSQRGRRRRAGIDLAKPRMRAVSEAVVALAANPTGFTLAELAARTQALWPQHPYTVRQAAYDIAKLCGKRLVQRIGTTRRYRPCMRALRTLAALIILREKVIKPVIAGAGKAKLGRSPKRLHPLDQHYIALQRELHATFETLKLAA
jgi:hypothetical protein